jgi:hypothetical protein
VGCAAVVWLGCSGPSLPSLCYQKGDHRGAKGSSLPWTWEMDSGAAGLLAIPKGSPVSQSPLEKGVGRRREETFPFPMVLG